MIEPAECVQVKGTCRPRGKRANIAESSSPYVFGPLRAVKQHRWALAGKSALDVRVCVPNTPQFVQNCPQIVIWSTVASNFLPEIPEFASFFFLRPLLLHKTVLNMLAAGAGFREGPAPESLKDPTTGGGEKA